MNQTKLNRIKAALLESIEISSKFTDGPWDDAIFLANARTMTPLACKALLTAIEGLEQIMSYGNQAPAHSHGICPYGCDTPSIAETALSSITSEWPDV